MVPLTSDSALGPAADPSDEPVRLAPRLNEHGAEILREVGYSADEIAAMVRDGVTRSAAE